MDDPLPELAATRKTKPSWKWIALAAALGICITSFLVLPLAKHQGWTYYSFSNSGLASGWIFDVAIDTHGQVWVGTESGLSVLGTDGQWITYTSANSPLGQGSVGALAFDEYGQLWIGAEGELFVLSPDGHWTICSAYQSGVSLARINELVIDTAGLVWVGTSEGVIMFSPGGPCTSYTAYSPGQEVGSVEALAIDQVGKVWIGTRSGYQNMGLSALSPDGQWMTYNKANSDLLSNMVTDLAIDDEGRLWVGTDRGLNVLVPEGLWTTLPGNWVLALEIGHDGRVWVGTTWGLRILMPDGQWITYTNSNSGLPVNWDVPVWLIQVLTVDTQGRVWIGSRTYGLAVLDPADCIAPGVVQAILYVRNTSLAASILLGLFVPLSWMKRRRKGKRSGQRIEPAKTEAPDEIDIEVF